MGALDNSNPLNHNRYTDTEAASAVANGDTYLLNSGDSMVGQLELLYADPTLVLNDAVDPGQDWAIRAQGEHFEIFEPEDGDKVAFSIVDGSVGDAKVVLSPEGIAALTASGDGNVAVGGSGSGNRTLTVRADTNSLASIEAYGFGGAQGSGQLYAGQSATHGGGIMYNGDGNPAMAGSSDQIALFRRSEGTDHVVMEFPHNSNTVTFSGEVKSQCPSNAHFVGHWCVEDNYRSSASYSGAVNTCIAQGMGICPLAALLACDLAQPNGAQCTSTTDGGSSLTMWTADFDVESGEDAHTRIMVFRGDNKVQTASTSSAHRYFCCTSANP